MIPHNATREFRKALKAGRRTNLRALSDAQLKKRFELSIRKGETSEQRRPISRELRRRVRVS